MLTFVGASTAQAGLGPANPAPRVTLAWDAEPSEAGVTNYTLYWGKSSQDYSVATQV